MRHTRMAALMLSLVTLLTTLCGCHGSRSQNAFTVPDSFDESRQYEITFWAKNDTNKTQVDIYSKAIADFQALYPNITVKLRLYTDYGKIYNDVITNIATNTTPNVCITYPDHIATYLTGDNVVAPLDALFADEQYGLGGSALRYDGPASEEMISRFLEECSFSGSHYAVPFMRSTEACYVNRTYVEALGYELPETLTWDFVWEVSEAAAAAKNADGTYTVNGQQVLLPFIYKSTDNMMIQLLRQKNAGYSTDSGDVQIFNDTTEDILYDVARHTASGAFSTFKISGYPANFLNAGQCLFAVDSTAGATWMGSHAPLSDISSDKYVDFETAVMAVPQCDPDHPQMISQGPSVCVFNKADKRTENDLKQILEKAKETLDDRGIEYFDIIAYSSFEEKEYFNINNKGLKAFLEFANGYTNNKENTTAQLNAIFKNIKTTYDEDMSKHEKIIADCKDVAKEQAHNITSVMTILSDSYMKMQKFKKSVSEVKKVEREIKSILYRMKSK